MLKRFVKFICVVLCLAMLLPFAAVAEGGDMEGVDLNYWASRIPYEEIYPIPFTDVTTNSWYNFACNFVYNTGLMVGTSETTFSPHAYVTREMAAFIIAKICMRGISVGNLFHLEYSGYDYGVIPHYKKYSFEDIEPGKWYSDAVEWAYKKGVTDGIGNGYFGVGQPVTREDFLTMLYKIIDTSDMGVYDYDVLSTLSEPVSDYAVEAVEFFRHEHYYFVGAHHGYLTGIPAVINGFPDGTYHLKDYVTRAEIAAMIVILTPYPNYRIKSEMCKTYT